jgi:toxin ParE1/3/4
VSRRLVIRSAARADILEHFTYLVDEAAVEAAARFLEGVEAATERIRELPGVGAPKELENPRLRGLRSWPVPGFEAVRLYYLDTGDTIRIVRVLHGRQDIDSILEREER